LRADHFALSDQLKSLTHEHYGLEGSLDCMHFEDRKDSPCPEFGGLTPRQAYIHYSEDILKPKFGRDRLGKLALPRIRKNMEAPRITLLSGVGFIDEVNPAIQLVGPARSLHLKVRGTAGGRGIRDSRQPLDLSRLGVQTHVLDNDGSSENCLLRALDITRLTIERTCQAV